MKKEVMADKIISAVENLVGNVMTSTGCLGKWGEVELPECLRSEMEIQEEQ